jgi:hypothetical protein
MAMTDGPTIGIDFLPHAIIQAFTTDEGNVVDALHEIADAIDGLAKEVKAAARHRPATNGSGTTEQVAVFNKPGD